MVDEQDIGFAHDGLPFLDSVCRNPSCGSEAPRWKAEEHLTSSMLLQSVAHAAIALSPMVATANPMIIPWGESLAILMLTAVTVLPLIGTPQDEDGFRRRLLREAGEAEDEIWLGSPKFWVGSPRHAIGFDDNSEFAGVQEAGKLMGGLRTAPPSGASLVVSKEDLQWWIARAASIAQLNTALDEAVSREDYTTAASLKAQLVLAENNSEPGR